MQARLHGGVVLLRGPVTPPVAEAARRGDSSVTVAGRQAQVLLGGEVTFLAASGGTWLVTATACVARPERPYDCLLEGD